MARREVSMTSEAGAQAGVTPTVDTEPLWRATRFDAFFAVLIAPWRPKMVDMSGQRGHRASPRSTGALILLAVALAGCGGSAPGVPGTPALASPQASAATPSSDDTARIGYDDAADLAAAAKNELVLNQEARADGGMAALIGD